MIRKYPCLCLVTHAHGHNDGGHAIVDHLTAKYPASLRNRTASTIVEYHQRKKVPGTVLLEEPYPLSASGIVDRHSLSPGDVTHVLTIVDANTFESDPDGKRLLSILKQNGTTGLALGNIWNFDPASLDATTMDALAPKTRGLVSYVEQHLRYSVVFLATGPETVIDREPFRMHDEPDPTSVIRYGQ